jgi:DNA-binding response OmpR family regulator
VRLLLVEDERKVASFIARSLRENSYTVDVVESGEKALGLVDQAKYDLILLDIRLPNLSGIEVCREIRDASTPAFARSLAVAFIKAGRNFMLRILSWTGLAES